MSRLALRGYIGSRPLDGQRVPQHVQNLVVRDYAARHGLEYRLSAAEYVMPGSYLMLEQVLAEIEASAELQGLIAYSLFMLPPDSRRRDAIWRRLAAAGAVFHAAVEELAVAGADDVERVETILSVHGALAAAPSPSFAI
ncbi:MAG: LIC12192 family sporadic carbohydrate cluster protein [Acidobacteriota bacterium]